MQTEPSTSLWTSMWFAPRKTIQTVIDTDPTHHLYTLIFLGGIGQAFNNASSQAMAALMPVKELVLMIILLGPVSGFLTVYLGGWIMHRICLRLGGTAPLSHIRAAIAWSWVPVAATAPLWIARLILFRHELFSASRPIIESQPTLAFLYDMTLFFDFIIALWSFFLLIQAVSQVNTFASLRGFASIFLTILVVSIPLLLLLSAISPIG